MCALVTMIPLANAFGVTGAALSTFVLAPLVDVVILRFLVDVPWHRWLANSAIGLGSALALSLALARFAHSIPALIALMTATGIAVLAVAWMADREVAGLVVRLARRRAQPES
jgi:hypothetical protein